MLCARQTYSLGRHQHFSIPSSVWMGKGTLWSVTVQQRWHALTEVTDSKGDWESFYLCLQQNYVASLLWFHSLNKENWWGSHLYDVMNTNNLNEFTNHRFNWNTGYKRSSAKVIPPIRLLKYLEKSDGEDTRNIFGQNGIRFGSTAFYSRERRKRPRDRTDDLKELNGEFTSASALKKVKRLISLVINISWQTWIPSRYAVKNR